MENFRSRTFTEYVQVIWRRKLLIFLISAGMMLSTYFVINGLPNVYESRATVVISGQLNERQAVNARVSAATEQMTSRAFLEPILERHSPYGARSGNLDAAIGQIRQNIKIDTFHRSDFPERLAIAYRHTDPGVAKAVATDLIAVFGRMNEAMEKQLADEKMSVASEIAEIEGRLREMGNQRAAARRRSAGRTSADVSDLRARRVAAASSIETLTDKKFALEQQIAEQKRQIAEQQEIVRLVPGDARATSSYGVLLVRKAELEAQLKEYATQYTDKNPKVIQTRNQLSEINHQIAQLNGGNQNGAAINSAEARELRAMQRDLARLQTDLGITERALERKQKSEPNAAAVAFAPAPIVSSADGETTPELQADYQILRARYDSLLHRQEQLAGTHVAMAGFDPGIFQVVDTPAVPQVPIGPNRLKYTMFALALSLGFALLVALAIEIPKLYSITDDRDVEYYLGVPVIALIPETVAPAREQSRLLLARTVGALLTVGLISVIIMLLS
jgi:uncharacterized protein involved in exopolysaccharide biosynthesis